MEFLDTIKSSDDIVKLINTDKDFTDKYLTVITFNKNYLIVSLENRNTNKYEQFVIYVKEEDNFIKLNKENITEDIKNDILKLITTLPTDFISYMK